MRNLIQIQMIDFTLLHLNKDGDCKETLEPLSFYKNDLYPLFIRKLCFVSKYPCISICLKANQKQNCLGVKGCFFSPCEQEKNAINQLFS